MIGGHPSKNPRARYSFTGLVASALLAGILGACGGGGGGGGGGSTTTSNWNRQAYHKAPNAEAGDEFGTSVAISGSTVAVGAFKEASSQTTITNGASASADNSASQSGAAYVFKLGS
jgi:hypothetical protein